MSDTTPGYTTHDLAARWRVSPDKIRGWILRGELRAINVADNACQRPRYVVTPDAVSEFERRRAAAKPPPAKRRKRAVEAVDYYPD